MKNQGCVADAFLERFGAALGCQMVDFGSPNQQNITKMAPIVDPKSIENRGCVADAFLERFGAATKMVTASSAFGPLLATIFDKNPKKWHPKRHPKIDAEKVSINYAKRLQNDAKMDAQIYDFSCFFEKGENARNYLFYNIKRGSGHLEMH